MDGGLYYFLRGSIETPPLLTSNPFRAIAHHRPFKQKRRRIHLLCTFLVLLNFTMLLSRFQIFDFVRKSLETRSNPNRCLGNA